MSASTGRADLAERLYVNGVHLHVDVGGEGPPILLLHGFTGSTRTWDPFIPHLRADHTTVAVDLLGHGLSDAPEESSRYLMDRTVEDLVSLLSAIDIPRAAVLGYSMGGRIALALATEHPEKVSVLVLEGASPGLEDVQARRQRMREDALLAAAIERGGIAEFVDRWENHPLFASQRSLPAERRIALHNQRLQNNTRGLASSLRGTGTGVQEPLWGRLTEVRVPTLLIVGETDSKYKAIAERMAKVMPRTTLEVVAGAGHAVHLEQPEEFGRLIKKFLAEHERQ